MLKIQLLRALWRILRPLTVRSGRVGALRCDGYRQVGGGTHLAQYCLRLSGHNGMCLSRVTSTGAYGPADFHPQQGGDQSFLAVCELCTRHIGWACLNCGLHTHISHQSTFCKVDGQSDVFVHWCCPGACHYSTTEGLLWRYAERKRNWPDDDEDDDRSCHCAAMTNPPCSNCELGLTDPDREVPF